jgi:hypothetical protein
VIKLVGFAAAGRNSYDGGIGTLRNPILAESCGA